MGINLKILRNPKTVIISSCFILLFFAASCSTEHAYHNSFRIPGKGWEIGKAFVFQDSLRKDQPEKLKASINLRHNALYPYSDLWLFIKIKTSDGYIHKDTIELKLANNDGKWTGTGWGSVYSLDYPFAEFKVLKGSEKRWFRIEIKNGMRDQTLTGLEDIGLELIFN